MESVAYIFIYNSNFSGVQVLQNFSADGTGFDSTESSTNTGSLSAPGGTITLAEPSGSESDSMFFPSDDLLGF